MFLQLSSNRFQFIILLNPVEIGLSIHKIRKKHTTKSVFVNSCKKLLQLELCCKNNIFHSYQLGYKSISGPSFEGLPWVPSNCDILSFYVIAPINFQDIFGEQLPFTQKIFRHLDPCIKIPNAGLVSWRIFSATLGIQINVRYTSITVLAPIKVALE